MLAALSCQTPGHPPCSFMIFGALHQQSSSYFDFISRQIDMGLDPYVMVPTRPPVVVNDHYNLYGMPVSHHADVVITEAIEPAIGSAAPLLVKTYQTPAGDLTTRVQKTGDWRWGDHVPFLDDYLIPRSEMFIVEDEEDLAAFQYLLAPPSSDEITAFSLDAAEANKFARQHDLLTAGGWGVGMDMLGWVHGLNHLVFNVYDRPEFIHDLFAMIGTWNRQRMGVVLEAGIDLYIKRAWYENSDFFTPPLWEKLILPELKRDVELAHSADAKFGYIITASAMPLLDLIIQAGVDVIIGVDPHTYDLALTKEKTAGQVCLWGGVNGHLTVEQGSQAEVQDEVITSLEVLGPDGLILSPVDNVREGTDQAIQNVRALIKTWQAYTGQI